MIQALDYGIDDGGGGGGGSYTPRTTTISTVSPEPTYYREPVLTREPIATREPIRSISTIEPEPILREPIRYSKPVVEPLFIDPDTEEPISEPEFIKRTMPEPEPQPAPIQTTTAVESSKTITVLDELGTPMQGAHVYFSENNGEVADSNGTVELATANTGANVTVSFMGFETQTFPFNAIPSVIKMVPEGSELPEVILDVAKKKSMVPMVMGGSLVALLLVLALSGKKKPKKVTL